MKKVKEIKLVNNCQFLAITYTYQDQSLEIFELVDLTENEPKKPVFSLDTRFNWEKDGFLPKNRRKVQLALQKIKSKDSKSEPNSEAEKEDKSPNSSLIFPLKVQVNE